MKVPEIVPNNRLYDKWANEIFFFSSKFKVMFRRLVV